jgi:hypothetical protein
MAAANATPGFSSIVFWLSRGLRTY